MAAKYSECGMPTSLNSINLPHTERLGKVKFHSGPVFSIHDGSSASLQPFQQGSLFSYSIHPPVLMHVIGEAVFWCYLVFF